MSEEEKEENWKKGYRVWKLGFKERDPRLKSTYQGTVWEPEEPKKEEIEELLGIRPPKEIRSDWKEGEDEPFEKTQKGLYSLKDLEELKRHGFPQAEIVGTITPYGKVAHGQTGYRAEKARVDTLFRKVAPCYICGKPAKVVVRQGEDLFYLCGLCRKRLERLVGRLGSSIEEYNLDELLDKLAEIYGAEVVDYPGEESE